MSAATEALGPLDRPIAVTFFRDEYATTKQEAALTPRVLAQRIKETWRAKKAELPWLKLARFGDVKTVKGSFRHDANVLAVSGVEGDYDGEQMPMADAVELLTKQGVACIAYASPSATAERHRWRVLCPFSAELPPNEREHVLGRLNGLLGGIFSVESFTLSQSYYFGGIAGNAAHHVELVDGTCIDQHDDLDEIWRGKPATESGPAGNTSSGPLNVAVLLKEIVEGANYHAAMIRLAGHWSSLGVPYVEVAQQLRAAMEAVPEAERHARWKARYDDIDRTLGYIFGKRIEEGEQRAGRADSNAPWPEPDMSLLRAEATAPPALPDDFLPPRWTRWLATTAECAGATPDHVLGSLLAGTAALIGNSRWGSPWPGWAEPTALNIALVGRPSSGKSPAMDATTADLAWIETGLNLDWKDRRRRFTTELTEAKTRRAAWEVEVKTAVKSGTPAPEMPKGAEEPDPIARRRVFSTDPTSQKAGRLSADNPHGLLLLRDELAGWVGSMDRYSSGGAGGDDRAFWVQGYGGRTWTPDRVKDGDAEISVSHLLWSVLGGIQPDRLASLLFKGDDDGLAARFLYIWPAARKPVRPSVLPDPEWARDALHRLRRLPWQPPEPIILRFSGGAADSLQAWREEAAAKEESASGLFLSWLGKLPGMALRLAVVLEHLAWAEHEGADPPAEIGEWAISTAADFLEQYAVPMARRAFGEAALPEAERDARRLARWLVRRRPIPETLNARELRRIADGPGIPDAARTETALGELAEAGWVRLAPLNRAGLGGRSRHDWNVNPALKGHVDGLA